MRWINRGKRWIGVATSVIACLVGMALLFSSCTKHPPSATDLMADLLAELEHPEMQLYFEGAMAEGEGSISEEALELLYGGHSPSEHAELYALALCKDDRIYEIHLYYALNATAASQIEELLRGRLEELQSKENYFYDPDSLAASGTVRRKGNWVCMFVTEDNAKAQEIVEGRI